MKNPEDNIPEDRSAVPIEKSLQAEASSANARINIPLNLNNWKDRPPAEQQELMWFHQHLLDEHLGWDAACKALGYDRTTIYRLLKGLYEADSWHKPVSAIRSYRKLVEARSTIHHQTFAENPISRLIFAGLDYAMANNSITTIIGEGGSGGALAISVADQVLMLQYAVYSVISPEGCASILWKTSDKAQDAAEAMGITAHRLKALGLVDKIVNEPVGGAHRDPKQMAAYLKRALNDAWRQLADLKPRELQDRRYERLQGYGRFSDTKAER